MQRFLKATKTNLSLILTMLLLSLSCRMWLGLGAAPQHHPMGDHQPRGGSTRAIWQLKKSSFSNKKCCPPSRSTGNHTGADGWEKRRENSKEVNQIPIQRMQESVSGALDPQGEFCWDEEEWTWGWRLQHDKVFKLCLSPLSVSVGSLANFLASDFVSDSGSPVIWKPHSSLTAKLSASFLLLILC